MYAARWAAIHVSYTTSILTSEKNHNISEDADDKLQEN